jgi:hypothetical protein
LGFLQHLYPPQYQQVLLLPVVRVVLVPQLQGLQVVLLPLQDLPQDPLEVVEYLVP